jgi:predicted lipid carrier protein YhbT
MLYVSRAFHIWLRLAPAELHERLLALSINHLLRGQILSSRLPELEGKRFRVCAHDVPIALTFEISAGKVVPTTLTPDVTFRARWVDFIALAKREEDPDTLFFQRHLSVEGETETGLHLKNLLDGWEYDVPAHVSAVLPAPLAQSALAISALARALHGLSQARRRSSRRNIRPAESSRAN